MFIFTFFFTIGLGIILIYPVLYITVHSAKKNAKMVRERADALIRAGKGQVDEINEIIDLLTKIKRRNLVESTEADRVRVEKLRSLRS